MEKRSDSHSDAKRLFTLKMEHNSDKENSEYLDIQGLSKYLEIKESTLYSLAAERKIPHFKIGRLVRFKKSDIDLWMDSHKKECIDIPKEARKILKAGRGSVRDINKVVRKAIEEAGQVGYTINHGKPDQVKGLGKGGHDGSF